MSSIKDFLTTPAKVDLESTISTLVRIYEKLAYCSYEKHCAISKLNSEMMSPIFKLLGTQDRKSVRLTCKTFKASIDNHVGIHVNLDQRSIDDGLKLSLPPPAASSIRLWNIANSKFLDYLLRRPNLTTLVTFSGQISLSAYTKIVSRCKNLQNIRFTDRSHLYSNILSMSMNNLHTLDIGCPGYSSEYVGDASIVPSIWLTYEILLRRLIVPNLKVLRIFFCCIEECSVLHQGITQIFRFLAVHDKVNELCINLHHRYERFRFLENDVNYRCFKIEVPKKILRRIQLQKLHVDIMEPAFKVWDSILPGQKILTHIDILNRGRRWFYFTKIVSNNFATLRVARFHNISPKRTKTPVLDAGVFEECQVLETLFLSRFENTTQEVIYCYPNENSDFPFLDTETSKTPEMKNLVKLPVTLKQLHVQGLVLSTAELCEGLAKLKNLQLLELQLTGYHNNNLPFSNNNDDNDDENATKLSVECLGNGLGVNGCVIQSIMKNCRKLNTLFIEEFENPWTKVRDTKLGSTIRKISHIVGDGYLRDGGYYGILICSSVPRNSGCLTRSERMHLWGVRVSQYCHERESTIAKRKRESKMYERDGVKDLAEMEVDLSHNNDGINGCKDFDCDEKDNYLPASSSCLLELLQKDNGQLENIQRLLDADCTSPPMTPSNNDKTEHTQRIAQEYNDTLFSAIPNYHKASRLLLDPTEKFASFFLRTKGATKGAFRVQREDDVL